jgi:uncharacterized protein (TIGR02301 family)
MRGVRFAALIVLTSVLPAGAQQKAKPPPSPPVRDVPTSVEAPPPPYEPQILKLAETMGSLAFLSRLCSETDTGQSPDLWRAKAQELLNAEETTATRKERFAGAFNRGFQGYQLAHRSCTANAELALHRLLQQGADLTHDLASRFGN